MYYLEQEIIFVSSSINVIGKYGMKKALLLFVVTIFVVACSGDKTRSEENAPMPKENVVEPPLYSKGVPPKPETKGVAGDISECMAKFKVRTEEFKDCVRAKYPHVKFAGDEDYISNPSDQSRDWCGKPKGQCPENPASLSHKREIKRILDSLKKVRDNSKGE